MDIDVMSKKIDRLLKHLPMLDEMKAEYDEHVRRRALRSADERAADIKCHVDSVTEAVGKTDDRTDYVKSQKRRATDFGGNTAEDERAAAVKGHVDEFATTV